jgi:uncharacterized membrane protein YdjX (TVP38/TMEM64 family)
MNWIKTLMEYLGGAQDEPPPGFPASFANAWFWGLWWGILVCLIFIFSGQSSKFIYIDF